MKHNKRSGKHALFIPTVYYDYCMGCGKCALKGWRPYLSHGEVVGEGG